jgi:phosphatidylserine/phosphatidylglycerophosphate/cardiolipin synthase-like enzyme
MMRMKRLFHRIALVVAIALFVAAIYFARNGSPRGSAPELTPDLTPVPASASGHRDIAVYFSPGDRCTDAIIAEIEDAKHSLDVQAYNFTSPRIASAVKAAFIRGVKVRVVLDKSQRTERYSSATYLLNSNVPVWIDDKHAIAHNKVMLIDGNTIITGSFNFTQAAERNNAENLLIIRGEPKLFTAYSENFARHLAHSTKYEGLDR